jgi:hypothetical protein
MKIPVKPQQYAVQLPVAAPTFRIYWTERSPMDVERNGYFSVFMCCGHCLVNNDPIFAPLLDSGNRQQLQKTKTVRNFPLFRSPLRYSSRLCP